ncbi:FeoC-like transcriptional regulator [Paracoccus versutus]|uniref:FeoC-like transcriptional regulator n=1 Tax=Paracoccus versutus TaxID=34007 RepID=UPI00090F2E9E|nr:FeoC-like transcriptional regulator [Paracoccus versutus]RDD68713.1 hypothetical protein DVR11_25480 [Paracoccus versutus]WGR59519.1 hypothetical protein E3U26_01680 [Paracoccus ferrooxidans]SFY10316.1 FeoC like transcriptional regulator [Paracoccus pantotrophus]
MTTLTALRDYMERAHRASLTDLSIALETSRDNAHAMMQIWAAKGRARLVADACGSCGKGPVCCTCPVAEMLPEVWEWIPREVPHG